MLLLDLVVAAREVETLLCLAGVLLLVVEVFALLEGAACLEFVVLELFTVLLGVVALLLVLELFTVLLGVVVRFVVLLGLLTLLLPEEFTVPLLL